VRALAIVVFGVLSLYEAAPAAWADEWIVDDTSATVHLNGRWDRTTTTPGYFGADYLVHAPGNAPALVRWPFPSSGTPGRYTVYVRYTSGPNRASAADYHVAAGDSSTDVAVNQQSGGGTWHSLGTFTFEPRGGQEVSLSGNADGVVVADAVAWVGPRSTDGAGEPTDLNSTAPVQGAVDSGAQPWRLDPLAVAHAEATPLGLASDDPMRLVEERPGSALVRARHASSTYEIALSQPASADPHGIWVVDSMRRV
jgi:hypothetical protein